MYESTKIYRRNIIIFYKVRRVPTRRTVVTVENPTLPRIHLSGGKPTDRGSTRNITMIFARSLGSDGYAAPPEGPGSCYIINVRRLHIKLTLLIVGEPEDKY